MMLGATAVILKALPRGQEAKEYQKPRFRSLSSGSLSLKKRLPPLYPIDDSTKYEKLHAFTHYSNWVIPGRLMVGRYPFIEPGLNRRCDSYEKGIRQLKSILRTGIRTFVCLQHELPHQREMYRQPVNGFHPYLEWSQAIAGGSIESVHFPIVDLSIPDAKALDEMLTDLIDRLKSGERIYIHCWGGRGRAGVVTCCLIAKAFKISADESLQRVGRAYLTRNDGPYRSPQTKQQVNFVRRFVANYC